MKRRSHIKWQQTEPHTGSGQHVDEEGLSMSAMGQTGFLAFYIWRSFDI
jgi:hypothetical protein